MNMSAKILHQTSWAKSVQQNDIELYSSLDGKSRPILMIGGVHGDEPEGVQLAKDLLLWLQKNNNNLKSWLLIPCLNVDGFLKKKRTNANGVDLNRNFPSSDWTSKCKSPRYFPGNFAASEPEVKELIRLIGLQKPSLIIHFHSWEPCVVFTGPPGKALAENLGRDKGYKVSEDIGYPTPGSLGQYGWLNHHTPVICLEAQEGAPLESVWPVFASGLQRVLRGENE